MILFGAIDHRLLVKPHPASPQPLPADVVSTQRTKIQKPSYANGLRWVLKLWKIQKRSTQPKHWSLIIVHVTRTAQPFVAVLFFMVPPKDTFASRMGYLSQAACS